MVHVDSLKLMCSSSKMVPKVDQKEVNVKKKIDKFFKNLRLHLPPIRDNNFTNV